MSDRILLTGATGFIGAAVLRAALKRGHAVLALVRPERNVELPGEVQWVEGDLENAPWKEIEGFKPTACIHCAWISTPGVYLEAPENERLVGASLNFLRLARAAGIRHAVVLGTCIEYAPASVPLREDDSPIGPVSLYARSKTKLHELLQQDPITKEMGLAWARVFHPYGVGEHPRRICSSTCQQLIRGGSIELRTPDSVKDYIHVQDVAEAILCLAKRAYQGTVNVGTGEGTSIVDLARMIARMVGEEKQVKRAEPGAADPYPYVVADSRRLRGLGWKPQIPLESGVRELCESLQKGVVA